MEAVKNDPNAMEMLKGLGVPKNDAETFDGYLKVAEAIGCDITKDELLDGLKAIMAEQKAASDSVAEKVSLEEEELEKVAGGAGVGCKDTYEEGEWCWYSDSCSLIITSYDDASSPADDDDDDYIGEACVATIWG